MSRRRRHTHEEHANHEAWAIPYGDLVTLLLAFFVVMYAISSVNEGKYRVLSDSMIAAFQGTPRTFNPVQVGEEGPLQGQRPPLVIAPPVPLPAPVVQPVVVELDAQPAAAPDPEASALAAMADQIEAAMSPLIEDDLVVVRRNATWIEVEIRTDILFASASAELGPKAVDVIPLLGRTLAPFPNDIRVEGHTDDRPMRSGAYRSNWELSAARAASVVYVMTDAGLDGRRLSVIAYGEHRPVAPNDTEAGRNANRRVVLVIAGSPEPRRSTTETQVAAR